jgi:hypothetical protein
MKKEIQLYEDRNFGVRHTWTEKTMVKLTIASKINASRDLIIKSDSNFWGSIFLKRKPHFTLWTVIWSSADWIVWH